ncbi:hypothetical protein FALBO_2506 [Fusarium albosuccineum]|uniref:MADS-box domain-containing protein n=1 Tax=Fusarium albosuccineum TaxID=1237068 RepID=A0A8H4LM24_9HYPO|nr:hypothetical protein FALBO_2506 [Fusarium albosuccineum]
MPNHGEPTKTNKPGPSTKSLQKKIFKKAHYLHRSFGSDVLVLVLSKDGRSAGYQSRPGLLKDLSNISVPAHRLMVPENFDLDTDKMMSSDSITNDNNSDMSVPTGSMEPLPSYGEDCTHNAALDHSCDWPLPYAQPCDLEYPPEPSWHCALPPSTGNGTSHHPESSSSEDQAMLLHHGQDFFQFPNDQYIQ